jgi:hypothetical protein
MAILGNAAANANNSFLYYYCSSVGQLLNADRYGDEYQLTDARWALNPTCRLFR